VFSVGGIQSSVATPVLDLGGVPVFVVVEPEPVPEPVVDATDVEGGTVETGAVEFDGAVELDAGVVLDTGAAPCVVLSATLVSVAAEGAGAGASDERSIRPTLGDTTTGVGSDTLAVSLELLVPSAPQAARPSVRRLHNTTLRMCD